MSFPIIVPNCTKKSLLTVFLTLIVCGSLLAQDSPEKVLVLGPFGSDDWLTYSQKDIRKQALANLGLHFSKKGLPAKDSDWQVFDQVNTWQLRQTATALADESQQEAIWMVSFNIETGRFTKGELVVSGPEVCELFHNAAHLPNTKNEETRTAYNLTLANGSHHFLALLKTAPTTLAITWKPDSTEEQVLFHTEPQSRVSATQLYHRNRITQTHLSPDGKFIAMGWRAWDQAANRFTNHFEIRTYKGDKILKSWSQNNPQSFMWQPDSQGFAYMANGSVWIEALETPKKNRISAGLEGLQLIDWHPTQNSLIVGVNHKGKDDLKGVKRYQALEDRWGGWRDTTQLASLDIHSGFLRVLTAEPFGASFQALDPKGETLLYTTSPPNYEQPPHQLTILKKLSLKDKTSEILGKFSTLNQIQFAKNGYFLTAGPSAFNNLGKALPAEMPVNDYDGQLYFWNPETNQTEAISKFFDPSINSFELMANGDILLWVTEKDTQTLYHYQVDRQAFRSLPIPVEVVERISVSKTKKPRLVFTGTSAATPQAAFTMVLGDAPKELANTQDAFKQNFFGDVKPWNFTNENGDEIIGRYYLPPGFSADNRYPLIVYYYGGTVPVNRQFTGRYPFNLWAANGYVVYVLQPSGTIGMGQKFSSLHVNAWGKQTAEDIITGTGQFIRDHSFIDGDKVGCIGASYGGFMTMYLITKTPFFKAAISHAGISDLSGYWGEGWWGYAYSGVATKGQFPWNNPEFYSKVSPLNHADKISTPLLLLHGDADTNVPPGQSQNMYTALKLLNKEVELITFNGEDHHILNPKLRLVWWDTILAWFDKQLKGQDSWWNHLYPEN